MPDLPRVSALFLPLLLSLAPHAQAELPRVASMHLCSDQLLLALAAPEQIASLSYLSSDPLYSPIAGQVQGFHLNHGQAEELLPLQPELVLTGAFSTLLAAQLLERQGLRVERLEVATSVAAQLAQIHQVGQWLGRAEWAEQVAAAMQQQINTRLAHLRPRLAGKRAAFYSSNGFSYGLDTLQHDFITSLGMHNSAVHISGVAPLPLEQLLRELPDYLFLDRAPQDEAPLAHALLQHPAFAALQDRLQFIVLPDTLFQCASPLFVDAYERLEAQLP